MLLPNHSLSRFLWKEYRTQRASWLALLIADALLQVLFLFFDDPTQRSLAVYPYAVGAVLTVCYAIACGAILFAGEQEDETDRLLQTLPFPVWTMTAGKLLYAVISVLLFAGLSLWGGYLVASIAGPQFTRFDWNASVNDAGRVSLLNYFLSGILGFAVAVLCSILTGRVMFALIGGAMGMTLLTAISHNYLPVIKHPVDLAASVLLIGVSVLLVPGWLHNRLRFPELWRRKTAEDAGPSQWNACRLRWLQGLSQRPTAAMRMSGVLLWKELRSAVPIYVIPFLMTAIVLVWQVISRLFVLKGVPESLVHLSGNQALAAFVMISSVPAMVMAAAASILSFSGDQTRQRMQFLTDRGAAPMAIWGAKQIVWLLPILLCLALSGAGLAFLLREPLIGDRRVEFEVSTRVESEVVAMYSVIVFGTVCTYAIAQLLSMWIRRTILVVSVSAVAAVAVGMGLFVQLELGIPLWMTAGVFTGTCLCASLFTLEGWLKQTCTWNWRAVQLAWIVVPLLLMTVTVREWRAFEIPLVNSGFDWHMQERSMSTFDAEWSTQWEHLQSLAVDRRNSGDEFLQQAMRAADRIVASPELPLVPWQRFDWSNRVNALLVVLNDQEWRGSASLDRQWELIRAACVLHNYWTGQALRSDEQNSCTANRKWLHATLQRWIQAPHQTPELLQRYLETDFHATQHSDMIKSRYVVLRQIFEQRGWAWDWLRKHNPSLSGLGNRMLSLALGGSENQRAIRLLNQQVNLEQLQNSITEEELLSRGQEAERWNLTTPWMRSYLTDIIGPPNLAYLNGQPTLFAGIAVSTGVEDAGPRILACLERYRLEQGSYPESLEMVLGSVPENIQLAAASYVYLPHGYPLPLVVTDRQVLPAAQPLLIRRQGWWDFMVTRAVPPDLLNPESQRVLQQIWRAQIKPAIAFSKLLWRYQGGLPTILNVRMTLELMSSLEKIPEPTDRLLLLNDLP